MKIYVGANGIKGDIYGEIENLKWLISDLRQLADGRLPKISNIMSAPCIEMWTTRDVHDARLAGLVCNQYCVTSELIVRAPDLGWVRTRSAFIRLGHSLHTEPRI